MLAATLFVLYSSMTWAASPSPDATNCYDILVSQRAANAGTAAAPLQATLLVTPLVRVCGPPFVWNLPPPPHPGYVQFICIRARDASQNVSDCADIKFAP